MDVCRCVCNKTTMWRDTVFTILSLGSLSQTNSGLITFLQTLFPIEIWPTPCSHGSKANTLIHIVEKLISTRGEDKEKAISKHNI